MIGSPSCRLNPTSRSWRRKRPKPTRKDRNADYARTGASYATMYDRSAESIVNGKYGGAVSTTAQIIGVRQVFFVQTQAGMEIY